MPHHATHIAQHLKATATNACGRLLRVDYGTGYQIFLTTNWAMFRKIFVPLQCENSCFQQ